MIVRTKDLTGAALHRADVMAQRIAELEKERDLLKRMLESVYDSGAWYISALEFNHGVNGEKLCQRVAEALHNGEQS